MTTVLLTSLAGVAMCLGLATGYTAAVIVVLAVTALLFGFLAAFWARTRRDISPLLLVPTALSAFQNVYLGLVVDNADSTALQLAILQNVAIAFATLTALVFESGTKGISRSARGYALLALVLATYSVIVSAFFHSDPSAAVASFRNVIAPFVFLLIGLLGARNVRLPAIGSGLSVIAVLAIAFGFYELLSPGIWNTLNLARLWASKGILVNPLTGLPGNFFASEQIVQGQFIRRMAGPFADPVNFGTFLFAVLAVSVYRRSVVIGLLSLCAILLAVSKGALLGGLVLAAIWAFYRTNRFIFGLTALSAIGFGLAFFVFATDSSTGSTAAHISGFADAFTTLPAHPLGRGLGGTGVLASLFSEGGDGAGAVAESGIGVVVGQLGVGGLVIYGALFYLLVRSLRRLRSESDRILGLSLCVGFLLNAAFNEVALSPNSCAIYFLLIGLLLGKPAEARSPAPVSLDRPLASIGQ